jgi:hypothetical protein
VRLAVTAQMFTETINTVLVKNTAFPSFLDILKETRGLKILDIFFMKSCRSLCLRTSSSIRNQDATGCTVHGSDSGGREIFCTRPDRPRRLHCLLYKEHRVSFPGVKRPRRGVDHPPPYSAEVKESVELYVYSPSGPSQPVTGWILPLCSISQLKSQNLLSD